LIQFARRATSAASSSGTDVNADVLAVGSRVKLLATDETGELVKKMRTGNKWKCLIDGQRKVRMRVVENMSTDLYVFKEQHLICDHVALNQLGGDCHDKRYSATVNAIRYINHTAINICGWRVNKHVVAY
jgi:hypothetical protein